MKINAVISKPSVKMDSANKSAIVSALAVSIGIVVGSIVYAISKGELTDTLLEYFISFSMDFTDKNKPEILSGIVLSNIPYFIAMVILGTSAVGTPVVLPLTFVKSMGLGLLTTYIYDAFALKGIEYCLLVLFPGKSVLIFAMILATQNSIITSNIIRKKLKYKDNGVVSLNKFALRATFILIMIMLSGVIDFLTLLSFNSLFNFT